MKNKAKHAKYYRRPRTTQERRANTKRSKWARGRRRMGNLINTYDDPQVCIQKTWKVKRRHQHRENARGKKHTLFLANEGGSSCRWLFWIKMWDLEEYLKNHDIPCHVRKIEQIEVRVQTHHERYVITGWEPYTKVCAVRPKKNGARKTETQYVTETGWRTVYGWRKVKLKEPREWRTSTLIGYEVTWWSDKDIGMDYILQQHVR
jgi:hypothetical protein